jgi:diguanylate cyclase (GGDEF)-like protein/PAS domain S-box-containing protein
MTVSLKSSVVKFYHLRKWLKAALQPAPVLCALMIVALWTVLSLVLMAERTRTVESAVQQGNNLVRLLQQNTDAMLMSVDRMILLLRQRYEDDPSGFDLKSLMRQSVSVGNLTTLFGITGEDGMSTAITSEGVERKAYLGDREYFAQLRDGALDNLLISGPTAGRFTGHQTLVLARRLRHPDGSFSGVVAAAVDPGFIGNFYASIDIGARANVVLRDFDGLILASAGTVVRTVGRQVMQPVLRSALAQSPNGYLWGGGAVDGVQRLVFYRKSENLPVVMTVGLAKDEVFANYVRFRWISVSAAIVLTLLLVLGAMSSVRHQLRLGRSLAARVAAEKDLEHARRFLDTVIEHLPLPLIVKDPRTLRLQLVNRAFEAFVGKPRDRLIGKTAYDLLRREDADIVIASDKEASRSEERRVTTEFTIHAPDKGARTVMTTRLVVHDDEGGPSHLIGVFEDVTDRREFDKRLFHMAHHDALTGLTNRASVAQKIEEAAARQRRWGHTFTVLMLDLDRFKHINDTLGHSAGDTLLRAVANRLKSVLRETDVLSRFGGDEFVIIQGNETNQREAAGTLAARIIDIVAEPYSIEGHEVHVGATVGISLAPEHATDAENLLKMADMALYSAKSAGRGGYCFFNAEMTEAAGVRREVETELRRALQNDEMELHYQPIIDAKTSTICGAEALIRWRHPSKGLIRPDQFIPLAEETGLITKLGEWVLHTACVEAASWPADIKVAVNLSPVQFRKCNLADVVMYALAQSGLPPERLEIEITETALIENAAECLPVLRQFKSLGIGIALDDFGTGYSSLGQLTMFPFDKIKIDKSFTRNMTQRSDCAAIIAAVVNLAHSLDIATTAEGVETAEQYEILRLAGVTSLQGFLFKRPAPAAELDFNRIYGTPGARDAA